MVHPPLIVSAVAAPAESAGGAVTVALFALIALALLFDFLNGFHDAANSIATIVSTRVLSPQMAVLWAAFFNFVAFLFFGLHVANTMGKGIIDPGIVDPRLIAATLIAACVWDIITWRWGLPTSSSHALIGGLMGAALIKAGSGSLIWGTILKTTVFIVVAPTLGMLIGLLLAVVVAWTFRNSARAKVDWLFRRGQFFSAAFYSLGHGGNDAQKTMGIIAVLLYYYGFRFEHLTATHHGTGVVAGIQEYFVSHLQNEFVPLWVVLACHAAMGLGTIFGGWRIVKTMGHRIVKLRPVDGFCAETGAALTLLQTLLGGIPVSTTHTIAGAIVGVGTTKRLTAVRWGIAGRVVWAWILTIPASAAISAVTWWALSMTR